MKFKLDHYFYWPVETIAGPLSKGEGIISLDDLPNVSDRKVIKTERRGSKLFSKVEWCVHGQIPKVAQKIIRPEMLTFIEESVWNDEDYSFTTKIKPHFLKDTIRCRTTSRYIEEGPAKTRRQFAGELRIAIPIIGSIVEKAIIGHLKKNNDENAKMMRKELTRRHGEPSES